MDATEIIPGLWQGGELLPVERGRFEAIVSLRLINSVLNLDPDLRAYLHIPLLDEAKPVPIREINVAVTFIDEYLCSTPDKPDPTVLVHCTEGRNRSGLIVGAFLIMRRGMDPDSAIALIRSKRANALSNQTFVQQLQDLGR